MKKKIAILLIACQIIMLCACSKAEAPASTQAPEQKVRETMVIGSLEEWEGADLFQTSSFYDAQMMIAEPLFVYDHKTGKPMGCLAEAPVFSEDGLTMTFKIPEGMKFPNGNSLDPDDVKASLEWGMKMSPFKDSLACINGIDTDGRNVILHLKEYSTTMLIMFASPFVCVIDSEQLSTMSAEDLLWGAVPYGPYYIDEYVQGGYAKLKRNENYFTQNPYVENKGVPFIKNIDVRFMTDEFSAITALQTGEIDFLINLSSDGLAQVKNIPNIEVNTSLPPMIRALEINAQAKFLDDINVRKALMYAIDRNGIVNALGGENAAQPGYAYVTKNVMFYTPQTEEYFKNNCCDNIELAKKMLTDAGFKDSDGDGVLDKNGEKFSISFVCSKSREQAAQAIQIQLQQLGIEANLETLAGNYVTSRIAEDNYGMTISSAWWSEPGMYLDILMDDKNNFDKTEFNAMVKELTTTVDDQKRMELVDKAQRVMIDQAVIVPLYMNTYIKAYKSELKGIVFITDGLFINDVK